MKFISMDYARDLDFGLLRSFLVVADEGSISLASNRLHLSQPAVSLQLKRLEEQVGGRLFDRQQRRIVLTPFGQFLLERARGLLSDSNHLLEELQTWGKTPRGVVRVGTYTTASSYLLAPILGGFFGEFPKVRVSYVYDETEIILDQLYENEIDCAVLSEVPADERFMLEPLASDELVFVTAASRGLPRQIPASGLTDFPYLSYPLRDDLCYQTVEKTYGAQLAKCRIPVETTSFDTLKQTLLSGVGATFMPRYLIRDELKSGRLREIRVGSRKLPIEFSFVTKRGSQRRPAVSALRSHLLS